jgi:hypothetical protein
VQVAEIFRTEQKTQKLDASGNNEAWKAPAKGRKRKGWSGHTGRAMEPRKMRRTIDSVGTS